MIRARELWTALSVIKGVLILDNLWGLFFLTKWEYLLEQTGGSCFSQRDQRRYVEKWIAKG
jgi:hypothetical protein